MQQAVTEANAVKTTNQHERRETIMTIITGRKSQDFLPFENNHMKRKYSINSLYNYCVN